MSKFKIFVIFLLVIVQSQLVTSQDKPSWQTKIDSVIDHFSIEDGPGGVVGIVKGSEIIYQKAFGYADVKSKTPNSVNTLFDIASVSKQFTAAAVLTLAEQGKIDLDEPIQKYLPELLIKRPIPIKNLLTHSSGLQDYSELMLLARGREEYKTYSKPQTLRLINRQTSLSFTPGTDENYSNTNYALLAELIKRVSGTSFETFMKTHLFDPLKIKKSEIQFDGINRLKTSHIATKYPRRNSKDKKNFEPVAPPIHKRIYGAGGLNANLSGLAKWIGNFKSGKIGKKSLSSLMLTRDTLSSGKKTRYARGVLQGTTRSGHRWVQHTGRGFGGTSILTWWRDADMSVIVLVNTDEIWAQRVLNKFLKDFLKTLPRPKPLRKRISRNKPEITKKRPEDKITPQPSIELPLSDLKKFVGTYPADAPVGSRTPPSGGTGVDRIVLRENKLKYIVYNGFEIDIKPIGSKVLELTGIGRPVQLRFENIGSPKLGFRTVDPKVNNGKIADKVVRILPKISSKEMLEICGEYSSPTLTNSIPIKLLCKDNKIYMEWGIKRKQAELFYLGNNRLTAWQSGGGKGMQANLILKRNLKNQIVGFSYEGHRVWHLFFNKINPQKKYPPPGELVDFGGFKLHLMVEGKKQKGPTVVFFHGAGDIALNWNLVLPEVGKFATAVAIDQAGEGWSEHGRGKSLKQQVFDSHKALKKAGYKAPYILVGHSLGGIIANIFAKEYADEVAGVVFVDATHPDVVLKIYNQTTKKAGWKRMRLNAKHVVPPVDKNPVKTPPVLSSFKGRKDFGDRLNKFSERDKKLFNWIYNVRPWTYVKGRPNYESEIFAEMFNNSEKYSLKDIPLIVLSGGAKEGKTGDKNWSSERLKTHSILLQKDHLYLSTNSKQIIAKKSGHHIHIDQPELVVKTINNLLKQIKRRKRR